MQHHKVSITSLCTTDVFFLRQFRTLKPPDMYLFMYKHHLMAF